MMIKCPIFASVSAIFIQLVSNLQLPLAKTVSVIALLPLVMFYTKLWYKGRWQAWNHIRTIMSICLFIYVPVTSIYLLIPQGVHWIKPFDAATVPIPQGSQLDFPGTPA